MNNDKIPMPSPVLAGFCTANIEALSKLKDELSLSMSLDTLLVLQKHFCNTEVRDITLDELIFADSLISLKKESVHTECVCELSTTDQRVGEGFDDLLSKLKYTATKAPYSYRTLLSASENALNAVGKSISQKGLRIFTCRNPLLRASAYGGKNVSVVKYGKYSCATAVCDESDKYKKTVADTDSYILIYRDDAYYTSDFESLVASMLINLQNSITVKYAAMTDKSGVINSILASAPGAYISYNDLCLSGAYYSSKDLACGLPKDSAVILTSGYSVSLIMKEIGKYGLKATVFGRASTAKRLNINTGAGAPVSFASYFLRDICSVSPVKAEISDGSRVCISPNNNDISLFGMHSFAKGSYAVIGEGNIISACDCGKLNFEGALLTVLESACRLVSCGASHKNIISSLQIRSHPGDCSDLTGACIGAYRTRAELALNSYKDSILNEPTEKSSMCAFAVSSHSKDIGTISHALSGSPESDIYLIAPRMADDGLPDFRDIRLILDYIHSLIAENKVIALRAVGSQGLEDTLLKMGMSDVTLDQKNVPFAPIGSFIVETAQKIDGFLLFSRLF